MAKSTTSIPPSEPESLDEALTHYQVEQAAKAAPPVPKAKPAPKVTNLADFPKWEVGDTRTGLEPDPDDIVTKAVRYWVEGNVVIAGHDAEDRKDLISHLQAILVKLNESNDGPGLSVGYDHEADGDAPISRRHWTLRRVVKEDIAYHIADNPGISYHDLARAMYYEPTQPWSNESAMAARAKLSVMLNKLIGLHWVRRDRTGGIIRLYPAGKYIRHDHNVRLSLSQIEAGRKILDQLPSYKGDTGLFLSHLFDALVENEV